MPRSALLVPTLFVPTLLVVTAALTGCVGLFGGGNAPQNYAFAFCQDQVTPKFEFPDTVVWSQYEGGPAGTDTYQFTTEVTAKGSAGPETPFTVECAVEGTENDFTLTSYTITEGTT